MSVSVRPILRPSTLTSLPSSIQPTTYICQACRHARLLRRPKRPYTFSQLITLSDGSAFMTRTTSPQPVYRATRDTRNALLWNPSSKELMNVEDDEAGRLAGFRARFGTMFDATRVTDEQQDQSKPRPLSESKAAGQLSEQDEEAGKQTTPDNKSKVASSKSKEEDEWQYEFEEDDANLLDLISSYGLPEQNAPAPAPAPAPAKGKKGEK